MKRLGVGLFVLSPLIYLLYLRLIPGADHIAVLQIFHFNIVTFITFSASIISILLSWTLGDAAAPRHYLTAVAFAAISVLFFGHGMVTPGALVPGLHPLLTWNAWLTLMVGGAIFSVASVYDRRWYPRSLSPRVVLWLTIVFIAIVYIIGLGRPDILDVINEQVDPWHQVTIFVLTMLFWLLAGINFTRTWRSSGKTADGVLAFVSFWMALAAVSMHNFDVWLYSWWLYHFLMLVSFVLTTYILITEYEHARQFNLLRYFLAVSLNVIGVLVLVMTALFANAVHRSLSEEILRQSNQRANDLIQGIAVNLDPDLSTESQLDRYRDTLVSGDALGFTIFDNSGRVYSVHTAAEDQLQIASETGSLVSGEKFEHFSTAMDLNTIAEIQGPGQAPEGYTLSQDVHTLILYAPLLDPGGGGTVGVIEMLDALPELTAATRESRVVGITIATVTTFTLFIALLLVVSRGDRILFERSRELNQAYNDLQRSEAIRDDLTRMIIHDLRNPLSAITASLDLMRMSDTEQSGARFTSLARDATRRMYSLIDDLLTVSQYEAGELNLDRTDNSVAGMLVPLVDAFRPQVNNEGKQISLECPPELRAAFDEPLVTRVVENLVGNAVKYVPAQTGRVHVRATTHGRRLIVSVRDNGEGVPDRYKESIFEKFIQVPEENQDIRKGTGLGLAFARMAVEAHGGEIRVSDIRGGGSDFTFWIPI